VQALVDEAPPPLLDAAPARRRRRAPVVVALVLVALVGLGLLEVSTDVSDRATIRAREATLAQVRFVQAEVAADQRATFAKLVTATGAENTSIAGLLQLRSELDTTTANLHAAGVAIDVHATNIDDLNTCLNGVEQALNAISVDSTSVAVAELQSVAGVCSEAQGSG
jgi:hypothetical protein